MNISQMSRKQYISPRRNRKSTLFRTAWELAAADGYMEDVKAVIEYTLPVGGEEDSRLTDYRFSVVPRLSFGSNEGIYLELYLEGSFDSSGRKEAHIGTIKTLRTDWEACQLMGSLGGALMYFAAQHVNQNLHCYTPKQKLEREYTRRLDRTVPDEHES